MAINCAARNKQLPLYSGDHLKLPLVSWRGEYSQFATIESLNSSGNKYGMAALNGLQMHVSTVEHVHSPILDPDVHVITRASPCNFFERPRHVDGCCSVSLLCHVPAGSALTSNAWEIPPGFKTCGTPGHEKMQAVFKEGCVQCSCFEALPRKPQFQN